MVESAVVYAGLIALFGGLVFVIPPVARRASPEPPGPRCDWIRSRPRGTSAK